MPYDQREQLYNYIITNRTQVQIIEGKNKGKNGIVVKLGELRNYKYKHNRYQYHNYFDLIIESRGKKIYTSCNYIKILQ
jgi:hypothetical protein